MQKTVKALLTVGAAAALLAGCVAPTVDDAGTAAPPVVEENAAAEQEAAEEEAAEEASQETVSQANARGSAEDYLDYTAFSKSGLIDQLEFEGFSNEQAEHGADSVGL